MAGLDMAKILKQKQELEARMARGKGGGTSVRWWKPQNGENRVRVLPGWTDEGEYAGQFWREVAQHWNVSQDQRGPVLCPKLTPGVHGECPICEFMDELKAQKADAAAQELRKKLRAKTAFFLNIIDVKDPVYTAEDVAKFKEGRPDGDVPFSVGDSKVQVWACQPTIFDQILGVIQTNDTNITDPKEGHDLSVKKFANTRDPMLTRYEVSIIIKPSVAKISQEKLEDLPDLSIIGRTQTYEELHKLLSEGEGGDFAAGPNKQLATNAGAGYRQPAKSAVKASAAAPARKASAAAPKEEEEGLPAAWGGADDGDDLLNEMESRMGTED